jgi:hypothetical protein
MLPRSFAAQSPGARSDAAHAEILAAEVVNLILPRVLADLGFFVGDDGHLGGRGGSTAAWWHPKLQRGG